MRYQISYYSPLGHIETIANSILQILPADTFISALEEGNEPCAQVQLIGFELGGTKLDAIPIKVLEYLEQLEDNVIFLFATVPFIPNDMVESRLENNAMPFLPDDCDYRGMYLCAAQPPEILLNDLRAIVSHHPENQRAKHWLERCENAANHPDESDIQKALRFTCHVLEVDE